jgi:type I restriction enzyme, S subunit
MRDGWIETSLQEIAEVIMGQSPDGKSYNQTGEGLPFMQGSAEFGDHYPTPEKWCSDPKKIAEPGDLLLSVRAPVGDTNFANQRLAVGRGLSVIRANSNSLTEFIRFVIQLNVSEMIASSGSGMFASITGTNLKEFKVLLPPLPEQKRIVDLISSVDSYIEALQQLLDSAKNFKSAYVNTIVSDIFARGKKTKIADIAEVKGGKRLPKGTPWSEEPTDHQYIRATDIKDGIILTENLVYVPDDVWPVISRYVVNQGDVVITIAGTIGQVGVIPASLDGVNLTENAAKIVVDRKLVRSNYLSMLLGSTYYQQDIDSKTKKTTQPKLGLNMINSIEIPLPDLAEQDEIFSVVSEIDMLISSTNDLVMQTITLRTGLLTDLLSGEHEIPASYDKVIGAA